MAAPWSDQTASSATIRDRPRSPARSSSSGRRSSRPAPTQASYSDAPARIRTGSWLATAASPAVDEATELAAADEVGDDIGHLPGRTVVGTDHVVGATI